MATKPQDILPDPPLELKEHSDRLVERIRERIALEGPIPFSVFMEMALYEPGLGYYSAGLQKFGSEGDFVTAPELGTIFAECLSRQIAEVMDELGPCDIVEIGAGSGKLARDLLIALGDHAAWARQNACSYRILERSAALRAIQGETLQSLTEVNAANVCWLDTPPCEPWQGIVIANEVVDALVVERFRIRQGELRQVCVDIQAGKLCYVDREAPGELAAAVAALGDLPEGYCSEINLHLSEWLAAVTRSLDRGILLFLDYGYPRREYYLPERSDGTLMAHYRHRAHSDLLYYPGLQDLTAWVDFTALSRAASSLGLEVLGYTSQAMFLIACGLDQVVERRRTGVPAEDMALGTEVRQLTLPGMMGERFQAMALGRNWPENRVLRGFSTSDLRYRL